MRGQCRRQGIARHLAAPEVVHHLHAQGRVVGEQVKRHRHARGERGVGQGALAEAVDGEDRCLIEGVQRLVEPQRHVGVSQAVLGAQGLQQRVNKGLGQRRPGAAQARQRLGQARTHTLAQFRRGRIGEGHDQYLLHIEPVLQQQAQIQAAEGPGLAGAGGGLDQAGAGQRAIKNIQGVCRHGIRLGCAAGRRLRRAWVRTPAPPAR